MTSTLRTMARNAALLGALAGAAALAAPRGAPAQEHHQHAKDTVAAARTGGVPEIPRSLREEHAELHARLVAATKAPGKVGEAARAVAAVLDPHFVREEQIALPPLGLLRALADNRTPAASMAAVLPLTDTLAAELPRMLAEHMRIGVAVQRLAREAKAARNAQAERLAAEIRHHALTEEEITYPAAVLVGDVVRARMRGPRTAATTTSDTTGLRPHDR